MVYLVSNLLLLILLFFTDNLNLWGITFGLWLNGILYAFHKVEARSFLFGFLVSFFIFLMTMDTMDRFFGYQSQLLSATLSEDTMRKVHTLYIVGLIGILGTYIILSTFRAKSGKRTMGKGVVDSTWLLAVQKSAKTFFYATIPLSLLKMFLTITTGGSYTSIYTAEAISSGGLFKLILHYGSLIAMVAFTVYLATLPSFAEARLILALWVLNSGLYLFTGRRREVALLLLFFFCYALARNRITPEEPWITKRSLFWAGLAVPVLVVIFTATELMRGLSNATGRGLEAIASFIYGQGVSMRTLANVISYHELLPNQHYLLEFTHQGLLPRLLGLEVFQGNSVQRAMEGNSLSHSLSYLVLGPDTYLSGIGTGSVFLAEGFMEGGVLGVFLLSILYGMLLHWVDSFADRGLFKATLCLLIVQSLLWAPRGSATGFISDLIDPATLGSLGLIFFLAMVLNRPSKNKNASQIPGEEATPQQSELSQPRALRPQQPLRSSHQRRAHYPADHHLIGSQADATPRSGL